jgi:hypothetical protein
MNFFSLLPTVIDIFRKGSAVADDVKGRNWAALGGALGLLIYAIAQAAKRLGYDLPIDNDTAQHIGVGIASAAGVFVTYGTSKGVGILPAKPADPAPAADVAAARVEPHAPEPSVSPSPGDLSRQDGESLHAGG